MSRLKPSNMLFCMEFTNKDMVHYQRPSPTLTPVSIPNKTSTNRSKKISVIVWSKITLLLSLALLLSACDLSYQAQHRVLIEVEQATITTDSLNTKDTASLQSIKALSFSGFNSNKILNFDQGESDVLLKIKVLNSKDRVNEFTLSLFPKYIDQVSYFNTNVDSEFSPVQHQYRTTDSEDRYFSNQRFAFNIDRQDITTTHYLLLKSDTNRYAQIDLVDTNSYIKADFKFSHFFTMVYSIILAMILFNAVFYVYTRDNSYLLYTLYMASALYSLLWQEGKINDIPWLAWHIIGSHSSLVFFIVSDTIAILFFYRFLSLNWRQSWLIKLVMLCVLFRLGIMLTALIQYHFLDNFRYSLLSNLFNLSAIFSTLLVWVIMLLRTIEGFPQAKYLFAAWSILIFTVALRLYFAFDPHPDRIWMSHSYEIGIMLEGLILAFAMANRTMEFRKQRDRAVNKYKSAERSIQQHQLITQFQSEMQELVKDPTLSEAEVNEKTNIKFHLLINKAFPIKNSMIHDSNQLSVICSTGLHSSDIEAVKQKIVEMKHSDASQQTNQFELVTANNKVMNLLYLPVSSSDSDDTQFILGLKNNQAINPGLLAKFKTYCEAAFEALSQAREVHQVALAANLDSMTGVHNRGSIEKVIKESLKNASRTTLAFVDMDDLKSINDQHGHSTGDQCIIDFVALLDSALTDQAKLGRIGGDEFVVVFSDVEFELCEHLIEQFMELLETTLFTDQQLTITTSVGLAESRVNETKKTLLKKADIALYHSKNQGKNQVTAYSLELQEHTD